MGPVKAMSGVGARLEWTEEGYSLLAPKNERTSRLVC